MLEKLRVPLPSEKLVNLRFKSRVIGIEEIDTTGRAKEETNYFVEKLTRLIPGEAIALFMFAQGLIGENRPITLIVWSLFCLFIAGLVRFVASGAEAKRQWGAIFISCVSFVIWLYNIGGPFSLVPQFHDPVIASLLVAGWTTLTTILYEPNEA